MKTALTLLLIFCTASTFAQVIKTASGNVNLQTAGHEQGYVISRSNDDDKTKVIWYTRYNLYRECGNFTELKSLSDAYYYKAGPCGCDEHFQGKFAATGVQATAPFGNIQFEFDSSVLKTSDYPVLDVVAANLLSSGVNVELDGYASSEGTAAHNLLLSKERAISVKTYLVHAGVLPKKIKVKGFGETHPIADNSSEEGRVVNRRVEFH
jgi:outer membrane protein OmpA-like peptidoglycan-associated protein